MTCIHRTPQTSGMSEGAGGKESLKGVLRCCNLCYRPNMVSARVRIPRSLLSLVTTCPAVIPLGRFGTADEAAAAYEFLLHPSNSYITGLVMNVDGGLGSVRVATPGNPEAPKSHA